MLASCTGKICQIPQNTCFVYAPNAHMHRHTRLCHACCRANSGDAGLLDGASFPHTRLTHGHSCVTMPCPYNTVHDRCMAMCKSIRFGKRSSCRCSAGYVHAPLSCAPIRSPSYCTVQDLEPERAQRRGPEFRQKDTPARAKGASMYVL